jgi:glutathione S-transferase
MFGAKAQIAALEKEIDFELIMVPFSLASRYEPKEPEVSRINPKRQVPVLVHSTVEIFDSTQIFEYLEDIKPYPALWPNTPELRAKARLLEHLSDEVFFPHVQLLMKRGQPSVEREQLSEAKQAILAFYSQISSQLQDQEFLVGSFSYADIAFFMAQFFSAILRVPIPEELHKLQAWKSRIEEKRSVQQVLNPMRQFLLENSIPVPA